MNARNSLMIKEYVLGSLPHLNKESHEPRGATMLHSLCKVRNEKDFRRLSSSSVPALQGHLEDHIYLGLAICVPNDRPPFEFSERNDPNEK